MVKPASVGWMNVQSQGCAESGVALGTGLTHAGVLIPVPSLSGYLPQDRSQTPSDPVPLSGNENSNGVHLPGLLWG